MPNFTSPFWQRGMIVVNIIFSYMKINNRSFMLGGMLCVLVQLFAQGPNSSGTYYQSADGQKGRGLKTALFGVINQHETLPYSGIWEAVKTTDKRSDGKVWDMYSSITNYTFGKDQAGQCPYEGAAYNREHSFPKSWFDDKSPMNTDLVHLVPTDGWVNNMRGNLPFGETDNPDKTSAGGFSKAGPSSVSGYSGTVFEPNDEYKGDFARIYFYMATCYEDKISTWSSPMLSGGQYTAYAGWAQEMLMRWAQEDPVSQKEIDRNNAVYEIQGNRNPFVDYPGLEQYVWGSMTESSFSYDEYIRPDGGSDPDPDPNPDPDPVSGDYVKVTSSADLQSGSFYLIVCEADKNGDPQAMAEQSGNIRTYAGVIISGDGSISTETGSAGQPRLFTLGGSEGAYTLHDAVGNNYLSYSGSKNELLSSSSPDSDNEKWAISISDGTAVITNAGNPARQIYYNTGAPRFACYKSKQADVALYKKNVTTSVEGPSVEDGERYVRVYGITGVVVRSGVPRVSALDGLPKGIYIIGGNKYVVK